jgi:WD40 repeat protein
MKRIAAILFILILTLGACSPTPTAVTPSPVPTEAATSTPRPADTATPAPTSSPTPLPTATPRIVRPTLQKITRENASTLTQEKLIGDGELSRLVLSPDGKVIAAASRIGIRFLDSQTLRERGFLQSSVAVSSLAFSPDGSLLAAGFENGRVWLYHSADLINSNDTSHKPVLEIRAHTFLVTAVRFSPDGTLLATSSRDRTANIWKVSDGTRLRPLGGFALTVTDIVFSADNRYTAASSIDGTIRVWELKSGNMLASAGQTDRFRKQISEYPAALAFDSDSNDLISGWGDGSLRTWHWQGKDAVPQKAAASPAAILRLISTGSGRLVSLDQDGNAITWKTGAAFTQDTETNLGESVHDLAISSDNSTWAVGKHPAIIETLNPSNPKTGLYYQRPGEAARLLDVVWPSAGNMLISASGDGMLRLWDVDQPVKPVEIPVEPGQAIVQLSLSEAGGWLGLAVAHRVDVYKLADLQAAFDGSIQIANLKPVTSIETVGTAHKLSISPDGSMLATSSMLSSTIQLWSLPDGKKLLDLTAFTHPIEAIAFSPLDNTLAVGSSDHRVLVWRNLQVKDLAGLTSDKDLESDYIKGGFVVTSLVWNQKADSLAISGTFKQARAANSADGQTRFYMNNATDQLVTSAWTPDGSLLASSGADGVIRLYSSKDGSLLAELRGHSGLVNTLIFSPKGDRLVSGGEDGTIRLWSLPTANR